MPGAIATIPKFQFSSATGIPMLYGTLTTYMAGSTTPAATWRDQALSAANTNPITLDARGECMIWLDPSKSYKFVLRDAGGVEQWTQDNISGAAAGNLSGVDGVLLVGNAADKRDLAASTGAALVGYLAPGVGAVATEVQTELRQRISALRYGATGNGVADDYQGVQRALTAGAGKEVYFPAATYLLTGGTPIVPANTRVILDPAAIVIQPNKGNYSAFAVAPGTVGVTIDGGDIRGPWYGTGPGLWVGRTNSITVDGDMLADLVENIGINIQGRWYQRQILGYNAAQMGALTDTSSRIAVRNCRIDGFGQEGILADNVTVFSALNNTIVNCGRGGVRTYGVLRGDIHQNTIGNLSPGWGGNYPNWNVYGVTATRVFGTAAIPDPALSIGRASQDVTVSHNHAYNCATWKSFDTHGGVDIRFIGNKGLNSYIGIGIDQGGIDATDGIAPALRTIIKGNILESTGATYMRAGMTLYGHDGTTQAADGIVVDGNILIGYGGNDTDGAISLSNVRNVAISGNIIKGAPRSAVNLTLICEEVQIIGNTLEDPQSYVTVAANVVGAGYTAAATSCSVAGGGGAGLVVIPNIVGGQVTSYSVVNPGTGYTSAPTVTVNGDGAGATATAAFNVGYGILSSTTTARAIIDANNIINKTQANTRGVSLQDPAAGYGVKVENGNTFTGTMTKVYPSLANERGGSFGRVDHALARITSAGLIVAGIGITSVTKTGTGTYDVVLDVAGSNVNNMIPDVAPYGNLRAGYATMTAANTLTVTTTTVAGAAADAGFTLTVKNILP